MKYTTGKALLLGVLVFASVDSVESMQHGRGKPQGRGSNGDSQQTYDKNRGLGNRGGRPFFRGSYRGSTGGRGSTEWMSEEARAVLAFVNRKQDEFVLVESMVFDSKQPIFIINDADQVAQAKELFGKRVAFKIGEQGIVTTIELSEGQYAFLSTLVADNSFFSMGEVYRIIIQDDSLVVKHIRKDSASDAGDDLTEE